MTAAVDPAALVAGHRCGDRCTRACHREIVWLPGPDGPGDLDRRAIAAGIVLTAITRPRTRPSAPPGLTARYTPWLVSWVSWARPVPLTRQAARDAPSKARAGVEPDERPGSQLELFPPGATPAASHGTQRPGRGT